MDADKNIRFFAGTDFFEDEFDVFIGEWAMAKARVFYLNDYRKSGNLLSRDLIAKLEGHFAEAGLVVNSGNVKSMPSLQPDYLAVLSNRIAAPEEAE